MTLKRLAAIGFIFACTACGWWILSATIFARTYKSGSLLRGQVESAWGSQQKQKPPMARVREKAADGKERWRLLPLERTDALVQLDLEHRQKGLLWFSTYRTAFEAEYAFRNDGPDAVTAEFHLELPAAKAVYDDLAVYRNAAPLVLANIGKTVVAELALGAGETAAVRVTYKSQGLDRWTYEFGEGARQVKSFQCRVKTNFQGVDFPENSLSPTTKRATGGGWELEWRYRNLVSGLPIVIGMPEHTQPGPLAGEISSFAPVSLFFFFFLMVMLTTMKGVELHPVNYFFLACAFFAFHLLLAYLVDHISIHVAFVICSAVSIALVVSYLRLVAGLRFAVVEAGLTQFAYLVLFSYAFFFPGYTGLAVTVGAIVTLFLMMQWTGRVNWAERFNAN